jgi:hypothetical protein
MSKKDHAKELREQASEHSTIDSVTRPDETLEPPVFYRCTCPECGEAALNCIESGLFMRSRVLGITSDGEIGCYRTELEGGYELGLLCRHCGHQVCTEYSESEPCEEDFLISWARSHGEALATLSFECPKCDSQELHKVEIGIEFSTAVVAVCESNAPGAPPLVALSHLRDTDGGGSFRYRCSKGHELAKDDGSPVETDEELIEWLKAHHDANKG